MLVWKVKRSKVIASSNLSEMLMRWIVYASSEHLSQLMLFLLVILTHKRNWEITLASFKVYCLFSTSLHHHGSNKTVNAFNHKFMNISLGNHKQDSVKLLLPVYRSFRLFVQCGWNNSAFSQTNETSREKQHRSFFFSEAPSLYSTFCLNILQSVQNWWQLQ